MENQLKSCKIYWPNLSKLEERLIKEGYLELGFVRNKGNVDDSERGAFLSGTTKFDDMVKVLLELNNGNLIKEKEITKYMNNPDKHKELLYKLKH